MGRVGIKNCYRCQRSLIWIISLMLSWMCVRVMLRNHISQIMMYGKFLQLFSRPSGHIVRRRYVKNYLINLNGRKGTGDHSEGDRSSSRDDVFVRQGDSSDLKYDQPVVYLTNYLVYGGRSCFSADVFKSKLHELSRLYNTMSWVASTTLWAESPLQHHELSRLYNTTKVYLTTEMILRTYKHPKSSCKVTNRSSVTIEDGWN